MITVSKEDKGYDATELLHMKCNHGDALYYPGLFDDIPYVFWGPVTKKYEEITPNSTGSRREWKDFEHYKVFTNPRSTQGLTELTAWAEVWEFPPHTYKVSSRHPQFGYCGYDAVTSGKVRPWADPGRPVAGLPVMYEKRLDNGFVPEPNNIDELQSLALRSIMPSIKAELSSLNSLIELKDFVSLPHLLKSLSRFIAVPFKGMTLKKWGAKLRESSRLGADGYLQWKFNISPLISDISGVYTALSTIEARINDLITRAGKPQRRHFVYTWQEFPKSVSENSQSFLLFPRFFLPNDKQLNGFHVNRLTNSNPSVFHVEVDFNFNFSKYQVEHARLLGLLDAFGVNLNPAIIWNAIPWSFVVDWLIGVGRFLDQFKVLNMEPVVNIRRYCWSIKRERTIFLTKWAHRPLLDTGWPPLPERDTAVLLPVVTETSYRRNCKLPASSLFLSTSGLSSQELTLGAALVIARRRRQTQRR